MPAAAVPQPATAEAAPEQPATATAAPTAALQPSSQEPRVVVASPETRYLEPAEKLRYIGLAIDTACLHLVFPAADVEQATKSLIERSGTTQDVLDRHLAGLNGDPETARPIEAARKVCAAAEGPVAKAPKLAQPAERLLVKLVDITLGGKGDLADDGVYYQTLEQLRTNAAFAEAFVFQTGTRLKSNPGGPSEQQAPLNTPCKTDAECAGDDICVDGTCTAPKGEAQPEPPKDPPAAEGCATDKDCKGDRVCVDKKCAEPSTAKPATDDKPVAESLRFEGRLGSDGTISFRIKGKTVTGATANVGGRNMSLRSSGIGGGGAFQLVGNSGGDYVRIQATYSSGKKWVKGSYTGTIARRKIGGSWSVSAR